VPTDAPSSGQPEPTQHRQHDNNGGSTEQPHSTDTSVARESSATPVKPPKPQKSRAALPPQTVTAPEHAVQQARDTRDPQYHTEGMPPVATKGSKDYGDIAKALTNAGRDHRQDTRRSNPVPGGVPDGNSWRHGAPDRWAFAQPDAQRHAMFFVPRYDRVQAAWQNHPVRFVYRIGGMPYVVVVPPGGNYVINTDYVGVYDYTAVVLNDDGSELGTFVGSVYAGGYQPTTYNNVTIYAGTTINNYSNYAPVSQVNVVDYGVDPDYATQGWHKVMLDGTSTAWGTWNGDNTQFTVCQSQQLPGVAEPAATMPIGLASAEQPAPAKLSLVQTGLMALGIVSMLGIVVLGGRKLLAKRRATNTSL